MSKYDALWKYIGECGDPRITLTFEKIRGNFRGRRLAIPF